MKNAVSSPENLALYVAGIRGLNAQEKLLVMILIDQECTGQTFAARRCKLCELLSCSRSTLNRMLARQEGKLWKRSPRSGSSNVIRLTAWIKKRLVKKAL